MPDHGTGDANFQRERESTNPRKPARLKVQSAMEYLMTYGWSILVLGVVVAVLFSLGVFNGGSGSVGSGTCVAISGYQCTQPTLYSSGTLSATIGEIGQTITVTGTACSSNSTYAPSNFNSTIPSVSLTSGQTAVLNFSCAGAVGQLGKTFTGSIWIRSISCSTCSPVKQLLGKIKVSVVNPSAGPSVYTAVAYVPITITNTNTVASTGTNFQQMITFNPTSYTSNEVSDLGNIRFMQNGVTLYSWCSSGCTSASSNAVFWVMIPTGIGFNAGGTANVVVNMTFLANTVEYDGVTAGEAPQLSATYGQYDNGASIFSIYFNGNVPTTSFTKASSITLTTNTVVPFGSSTITALQVTGGDTGINGIFYNAASIPLTSAIAEASAAQYANTGGSYLLVGLQDINSATNPGNLIGVGSGYSSSYFYQGYITGSVRYQAYNIQGAATTDFKFYSLTFSGVSTTSYYSYVAPQLYSTSGGYSGTLNVNPISGSSLYLGIGYGAGGGQYLHYNWARVRFNPPGGVMPTTSFGAISH